MGGLFGGYDSPKAPAAAPPVPNAANSQTDTDIAAREMALRLQRGRSATQLTGGGGLTDMGSTSKTLLGQ
jgi:hypothetical protein